jgi:hypothetical protein
LDGFEWCTQGFCGSADFAGTFVGKVGRRSAFGVWDIAANFDQLPPPGESVGITGTWSLSTSRGSFSGTLAGQLHNNGDNTFDVDAVLTLTSGGTGSLDVSAVLNHNTFPPTIRGSLAQ